MIKKIVTPTLPKIISTIILTSILLFLSEAYATVDGGIIESGFPLHYKIDIFGELPPPGISPSKGSLEISYVNLSIDIIFWIIISYIIVCVITLIFKRLKK